MSLSLRSQEQYESDQHEWRPDPQDSTERQLPEVEPDEGHQPSLGPPPSAQDEHAGGCLSEDEHCNEQVLVRYHQRFPRVGDEGEGRGTREVVVISIVRRQVDRVHGRAEQDEEDTDRPAPHVPGTTAMARLQRRHERDASEHQPHDLFHGALLLHQSYAAYRPGRPTQDNHSDLAKASYPDSSHGGRRRLGVKAPKA